MRNLNFTAYFTERVAGPQTHDELLARYPDPESRDLISKGVHPGTLGPIPIALRPGYKLSDAPPATAAPTPASPLPAPYRLMKDNPQAGQKDRWGRTIYSPDQHPDYLKRQDDIRRKMTGGRATPYGGTPPEQERDRWGRRTGYGLADG